VQGKSLQFRWDAFNATNHPVFSNPASTVNQTHYDQKHPEKGGVFGVVTGTNSSPRSFQGALRITF
jgi:hypothetical protein